MNLVCPYRAALLAALAGLALASCDRDATERAQKGADTVGQKVDRALERTQQKLAEAGRRIKPELERAGESLSKAANNAEERIKHADAKSAPAGNGASPPSGAAASTTTTTVTTGERTSVTGGFSAEARSKLSDTAITASIKADYLKDPDLSVLKIDVDTAGGVVTLNGLAKDEAARKRAEQMAAAVKGVTEVRNYLTVKRG